MLKKIKYLAVMLLLCTKVFAQDDPEARVPAYTLPEILKTNNGKAVNTVAEWEKTRRPEIISLFENNVYGVPPKSFDKITYEVTQDDPKAMDGRAHLKEVTIT